MIGVNLFKQKDRKVGVALGGGAVWAFAHIGVLEVFEENGIAIDGIAGTSAGSIVAAFYAFGLKLHEIKEIALSLTLSDVFHWKVSKLGLSQTDKIGSLMEKHVGSVKIGDAKLPLFITATDLLSSEPYVFRPDADLSLAVCASCAIPGVFVPVEDKERVFVDGSLLADVNCRVLRENGFDVVIGVELNSYLKKKKPSNMFEVILESFQSMVEKSNRELEKYADVMIKVDMEGVGRFEIEKAPLILQKGREKAFELVDRIKSLV